METFYDSVTEQSHNPNDLEDIVMTRDYGEEEKSELETTLIKAGFELILDQPRFLLYKKEKRDGKTTKVPYTINNTKGASTDPTTWEDFKTVYKAYESGEGLYDGIGIVLGDLFRTKIVGMDLDHVIDAVTGKFTNPEAERAVGPIRTYGERSVSGTGCHFLFLNCDVPTGYKTRSGVDASFDLEVYERGRYFTLSGDWINDMQIAKDQDGLSATCTKYLKKVVKDRPVEITYDTPEIRVAKARRGIGIEAALEQDERFRALYEGKRPLGNESSDDMALVNLLVKYIGRDPSKVTRAFLESAHYKTKDGSHKDKCDREDYLPRTIESSIESYYACFTFDDVGNAEYFTETFGKELVFVPEWNMWVGWDGKKWVKRAELTAQEKAKQLADINRAKVDEYRSNKTHDDNLLKAMDAHAKKMRSERGISNMIKLARSSALQKANVFDNDPMLFNCANGVFDMRTQTLYPHSSKYYCTNISSVNYVKGAECPKWSAFLDKVLPGEVRDFLQMAVGMAAVGKVYEEAMIFMIGTGSNGKSTIANILSAVFGDYSLTLQPDVIKATRDGKTPCDFAEVRGKRMVFISETEEGDRFSTQALKRLTSNEKQSARRLYSQPEEFDPSHTVFYSTNHKPRIGSGDHGTWRRIKNVPFEYKFTDAEKITSFAQDVITFEGEGVLAWVMEGARMFIENGMKLKTPEIVQAATDDYRENEDMIAQFLEEKALIAPKMTDAMGNVCRNEVGGGDFYTLYKEFCKENSAFCKNVSDFNNCISNIPDVIKVNRHGKRMWIGIGKKEM